MLRYKCQSIQGDVYSFPFTSLLYLTKENKDCSWPRLDLPFCEKALKTVEPFFRAFYMYGFFEEKGRGISTRVAHSMATGEFR